MDPITQALHCRVDARDAAPVVTPLFQSSAFQAGSPYFYTRKDNPNVAELERVVATLEGARHGVAVSTGMAAISAVLELLRPGDALVLNRLVYGCSFKRVQRFAAQWRLDLRVLDLTSADDLARLPANLRLVLFETPTNPFLRTIDIATVARAARAANPDALVAVDNTWATPLLQRPLEHGADLSLHSATKYFSGHSDVMGGLVLTDSDALAEAVRAGRFYGGAVLDPHSAWLLCRSLQTLGVRLRAQGATTRRLVEFLSARRQVSRVYYPEIDGRQLRGYATLVFFELRDDLVARYAEFAERLRLFSTGTGMACVTSMVAQPFTGSHASMTDAEKAQMGLGRSLVRLSFGLEDPADLEDDLAAALDAIDGARGVPDHRGMP